MSSVAVRKQLVTNELQFMTKLNKCSTECKTNANVYSRKKNSISSKVYFEKRFETFQFRMKKTKTSFSSCNDIFFFLQTLCFSNLFLTSSVFLAVLFCSFKSPKTSNTKTIKCLNQWRLINKKSLGCSVGVCFPLLLLFVPFSCDFFKFFLF